MTQLPMFDAPEEQKPRLTRVPSSLLDVRPANDVRPDPRQIAAGARGVVRAVEAVIRAKAGEP